MKLGACGPVCPGLHVCVCECVPVCVLVVVCVCVHACVRSVCDCVCALNVPSLYICVECMCVWQD